MITAVQYRRLAAMGVLLTLSLCSLGFRLVQLQVIRHEEFQAQARVNTQRTFVRESQRGDILDRRGNLLARSYAAKRVCAAPYYIGPYYREVAEALAPLLEMPEERLREMLSRPMRMTSGGKMVPNYYQVLRARVPLERWEEIQEVMKTLPLRVDDELSLQERRAIQAMRSQGLFARDEQVRAYPNGTLAAHVLGFVGPPEQETPGGIDLTGKEGVELAFNRALSGMRGWRSTAINRRQREQVLFREQDVAPRGGLNVVLTLDVGIQHIVESELAEAVKQHTPKSATAIVVRPKTGEILALANWPTFDPGNFGASPPDFWRNRSITDIAEPGSTFKIVTFAGALNERLITLDDLIDCEGGRFVFPNKILRDAGRGHGVITAELVMAKSSNIGTAKIGLKLGPERLHRYIRDFGFGAPTEIPLLGEVGGIVHPVRNWSGISIVQLPMGHEVAVTPLQMTMAMSAVANGGRLMRPLLVDRFEDEHGEVVFEYRPHMVRQVVSEEAARQAVASLKRVVSSDGTGIRARLDHYTVAGKTGTAQKPGPGGYATGKYYSSFIGFFPADDPEICIAVAFDEPSKGYYGSTVAAPVFQRMAERAAKYLAIRPDRPTAEGLAGGNSSGGGSAQRTN